MMKLQLRGRDHLTWYVMELGTILGVTESKVLLCSTLLQNAAFLRTASPLYVCLPWLPYCSTASKIVSLGSQIHITLSVTQ